MNAPITISATLPAWLFYFYSVDDLTAAIESDDPARAFTMLSFTSSDRSQGENPYTHIGEAQITVTLRPRDQLVATQIEALQAALARERAESVRRQNAIQDRISKLQALSYDETRTVEA